MAEESQVEAAAPSVFLTDESSAGLVADEMPVLIERGSSALLQFTYPVSVEAEYGLALNPPQLFTKEDQPLVLVLNTSLTGIGPDIGTDLSLAFRIGMITTADFGDPTGIRTLDTEIEDHQERSRYA